MILVVLGTHELPFTRLLTEVEKLKKENYLEDDIIVQSGNTKFESEYLTLKPFMSYEEIDALYDKARLIITHAGTGSVISGLKKGKKVIVAARLEKYGEHNDDHQLELVEVFVEKGHVISWDDGESLKEVLEQVDTFKPKPFKSNKEKMLGIIKEFIETSV